jgi:hypothetical protein
MNDTFHLLSLANEAEYPMGFGTDGSNDKERNQCGIATAHAYSLIDTFVMIDALNVTHKMILARNPWGITHYSSTWSKDDPNWTDDLMA